MTVEHYIGFVFCLIPSVHWAMFWFNEWERIHCGLRGKDGLWQAVEIVIYAALVIWFPMIIADAFFGFHASANAWHSIDIVIGVGVLGVSYKHYLKYKSETPSKAPEEKDAEETANKGL